MPVINPQAIHPAAMDVILSRLGTDSPSSLHLFDPCAGDGAATEQLRKSLKLPAENVWPLELNAGKGEKLKALYHNAIAPADAFCCRVATDAFSLVYCHSPFGEHSDGGRIETVYLRRCVNRLVPGGVFVQVLPEQITESDKYRNAATRMLEQVTRIRLPGCKNNEAVLIGVRRREEVSPRAIYSVAPREYVYFPPPSRGPLPYWKKEGLTDDEIEWALEGSPLMRNLDTPPTRPSPRPPLALGKGHVALLLATGELDNIVRPTDGGPLHVIRGVARKADEETESDREVKGDTITTTTKVTQRIQVFIRALTADGSIFTLE